jgi:hypothetical protein
VGVGPGTGHLWHPGNPPKWHKYYTIIPRKIGKKWYCCEIVYRKFVLSPGGGFWRYGNEFDMLRDI